MSVRTLMTMRATVQRNTTTARDAYGQKDPAAWTTLYPALSCRVFTPRSQRVIGDERTIVDTDLDMAVPLGTDIQHDDQVLQVADKLGSVLYGQCMVRSVTRTVGYLHVRLRRVEG